jgi:hypothetical protein
MRKTFWCSCTGAGVSSDTMPMGNIWELSLAAYFTDGRGNEWIAGELYTIVLMDPVELYTIAV